MKHIPFSFLVFMGSIYATSAQTATTEDENYKHVSTVHQHKATTFIESDSIALRNQRTHQSDTRKYIVAPSDSLPNSNVQGEKTKANYKNQFN